MPQALRRSKHSDSDMKHDENVFDQLHSEHVQADLHKLEFFRRGRERLFLPLSENAIDVRARFSICRDSMEAGKHPCCG